MDSQIFKRKSSTRRAGAHRNLPVIGQPPRGEKVLVASCPQLLSELSLILNPVVARRNVHQVAMFRMENLSRLVKPKNRPIENVSASERIDLDTGKRIQAMAAPLRAAASQLKRRVTDRQKMWPMIIHKAVIKPE